MPNGCTKFAHHKDLCTGAWCSCVYIELIHLRARMELYKRVNRWLTPTMKILWTCLHQSNGQHWIAIRNTLCSEDVNEASEGLGRQTIRRACLAVRRIATDLKPAIDPEEEERMAQIICQFGLPDFKRGLLQEQCSKEQVKYMLGVRRDDPAHFQDLQWEWFKWNKWCVGANASIPLQNRLAARRFEIFKANPYDPCDLYTHNTLIALQYIRCDTDPDIEPYLTPKEKVWFARPAWVTDVRWDYKMGCQEGLANEAWKKRVERNNAKFKANMEAERAFEARVREGIERWKAAVEADKAERGIAPRVRTPSPPRRTHEVPLRDVIDLTGD